MKLRESFRFPYPVLTEGSGDYPTDQIGLRLEVEERPASGALKLKHELTIDSPTLNPRVQAGDARCFLSVVCREAFYNEFLPVSDYNGEVEVGPGKLAGRVEVRAIVTSVSNKPLDAIGLQQDYSTTKFDLPSGAVLAWSEQQNFSVGMDKLAPMESIFKLGRSDDLPEGTFSVSYDDDYITIQAPEKLLATIHGMRNVSKARPIALNAIYMPALMQVIEAFRTGDDFEGRRWHRILCAKAEHAGIDLGAPDALKTVQLLLRAPASRLAALVEKAL